MSSDFRILFNIGPVTIFTWGFLLGVAIAVAAIWVGRQMKSSGLPSQLPYDLLLWSTPLAVVLARLVYVVLNWSDYSGTPASMVQVWTGGLTFHGALAGMILGAFIVCRLHRLEFWRVVDICAPGVVLAYAIGRVGCFFNSCCYGRPTEIFGGVRFHDVVSNVMTTPRHPTQLYSTFFALVVFTVLLRLRRDVTPAGQIFCWSFGFMSAARFFVEFFRKGVSAELFLFGLTQAQWVSLFIMAALVCLYRYVSRRSAVAPKTILS